MNKLWIAKGRWEGEWVYLTTHVGRSRQDLADKIMAAARRERFDGTLSEWLKRLDWEIVEVVFHEMPRCTCDLRTRGVGDGCSVCNPEYWADMLKEDE